MKNKNYKINILIVFFIGSLISSLIIFNCAKKKEIETISLRLKWVHLAQFAGFYLADFKGYYKKTGIDISIRPGGINLNSIKLVASGSDQFGVAGMGEILMAREKDIPVVALAVIYKKSPVCFFARKESGIKTPQDFIGKKVGVKYGTNVETEYRAMMNKLGIEMSSVQEVPVQAYMGLFFANKVDVWPGYVIDEALVPKERGIDINVICPSDYGIRMYADTLFTTEKMIEENPNLVLSFVKASIEGWKRAIEYHEEGVEATLKMSKELNREHENMVMKSSIPLIVPEGSDLNEIGTIDPTILTEMQSLLIEQGLMKKDVDLSKVYTIKFLQ